MGGALQGRRKQLAFGMAERTSCIYYDVLVPLTYTYTHTSMHIFTMLLHVIGLCHFVSAILISCTRLLPDLCLGLANPLFSAGESIHGYL